MFVLESKREDNQIIMLKAKLATSISSDLRHLPFDVIAVYVSYGIGIIKILKCQQILINPLHKRQKYPGMRERHPTVIAV